MDPEDFNSDNQSNGLFGLIQTLGIAYLGSETAKANAAAAAQKNASSTSLDATGKPVQTMVPAASGQWISGVSNQTVILGGFAALALIIGVPLAIRAIK